MRRYTIPLVNLPPTSPFPHGRECADTGWLFSCMCRSVCLTHWSLIFLTFVQVRISGIDRGSEIKHISQSACPGWMKRTGAIPPVERNKSPLAYSECAGIKVFVVVMLTDAVSPSVNRNGPDQTWLLPENSTFCQSACWNSIYGCNYVLMLPSRWDLWLGSCAEAFATLRCPPPPCIMLENVV